MSSGDISIAVVDIKKLRWIPKCVVIGEVITVMHCQTKAIDTGTPLICVEGFLTSILLHLIFHFKKQMLSHWAGNTYLR